MPGSWLPVLLGAVSVLIQRQHQLVIARACQYAVPIQGVFADDVGEAGSGLIAGVCADDLADGAGQGLAGAAGYVVVNLCECQRKSEPSANQYLSHLCERILEPPTPKVTANT